ncbi:MAG: CPBP family intramembrane glutamic endopeptidase [Bacteroidota bacterium]
MVLRKEIRIFIFYAIAIGLSNIFRFQLFGLDGFYESIPVWGKLLTSPLQSSGTLIGSLLALYFLRKERKLSHSLWGSSKKWSGLLALIPLLVFGIWGIENKEGYNPHIIGLSMGLSFLVYCVFEEFAWRGYLEDEWKDMPEGKRILLIAALWYVWHLSFLYEHDMLSQLIFFGLLVLGSWGMGKIIHSTKSVLASSCFHMLYNIWMLRSGFEVVLETPKKLIIMGICLLVWIIILRLWEKQSPLAEKKSFLP